MKKLKLLILSCIICFFISIFMSNSVFAYQDGQVVDKNKIWTLVFTTDVGFDDATKNAIIVKDSKENKINTTLQTSDNPKEVKILPPAEGYTPGENYTINVGKQAHSKKGTQMKQDRIVHFNIKNDESNIDISNYTIKLDPKMNDKLQQNLDITLPNNINSSQYDIYLQGYFEGRKLTYNKNTNSFNYVIEYGYPNDSLYIENDIRKIIRIQKKDGTNIWNPSNDTYIGIKDIPENMRYIDVAINQGDNYTLPSSVIVVLNDDTTKTVDVLWDKTIDTSKSGKYVYYGSLKGFKDVAWNKLRLILTVNQKTNVDESKIIVQHDDVENITWYMPETYISGNVYVYIGKNASKGIWLRQAYKYHQNEDIYIEQYIINIDGEIYRITPNIGDVKYTFTNGETIAIYDTNIDLDLMKKIASSTKTIIRMQGDSYSKDFTISQIEKDNIINILNKYNQMLGK